MASFSSVYAANRTTIVGAGAAVVIAVAAVLGLRSRQPTVQVVASAPAAGAAGGADFGTISAAYGAGASAASSGLGVGSDLGQAAMGLAGNVVSSQAYVAQTLAGSQADVAMASTTDFASIVAALIGAGQTTVPPPPTVVYTFAPALAPAPAAAPVAAPVAAPAPVVNRHVLTFTAGARVRVYVVASRGCISSWTDYTAAAGTATCGPAYHLSTCAGTSGATVVGAWSGAYAGKIIAVGNGVTYA